ncbi:MAG TPA: phosphatase PAP2 family protein [Puia sp.]|nr:phosphatase PAP2 family protein [Puia sp.]
MTHRLLFIVLFALIATPTPAQTDSIGHSQHIRPVALIIPGALTAYGFAALGWAPLETFDNKVWKTVWIDNPHRPLPLDNYLQYGSGLAVYALNAAGIKGRHNFRDLTIIYLVANGIMGAAVLSLKHFIPARRPDGSGNDGFPSGHSGTAFVGAEFMRQEYIDRSPWYGVAGYTAGAATGFLRIYNDKHWFSEVITGAGIGILASKAAYWLYPAIERALGLRKRTQLVSLF